MPECYEFVIQSPVSKRPSIPPTLIRYRRIHDTYGEHVRYAPASKASEDSDNSILFEIRHNVTLLNSVTPRNRHRSGRQAATPKQVGGWQGSILLPAYATPVSVYPIRDTQVTIPDSRHARRDKIVVLSDSRSILRDTRYAIHTSRSPIHDTGYATRTS